MRSILFGFLAVSLAAGGQAPAEAKAPVKVSVKDVADNPSKYAGSVLKVTGKLENEGKNYFNDLRVVLKDDRGNSLYVRPWLPAELPPARPGSSAGRRATLSDFLGKKVELTATLERDSLKGAGEVYLLVVQSATVIR